MDQERFINAMRDSMLSAYLSDKGGRERAGPALAKLAIIVPIVARFSLLGFIAYIGYAAWLSREILLCAILAILWFGRNHIRLFSFTGQLGSARFMTLPEMRRYGYLDSGSGLILGRARETRPGRLMATIRLATKPIAESEAAIRSFLDSMSGGRLNLIRIRDEPIVRIKDFVHTLLVAPPRTGKGVSFLVPTLMTWGEACVVGDPKDGELYGLTADIRRAKGFDVIRLDPFNVHGPGGHTINILEGFHESDPMLRANVNQLADTLIPKDTNARDPHFPLNAYGLLSAVILYVVVHAPPGHKNMNLVRYLLSDLKLLKGYHNNRGEPVKGVFDQMAESSAVGGILAEQGNRFANIPEREFGSILSTAQTAIDFLGDPLIAKHIERSSFDIQATTRDTTVYLILPAKLMSSYASMMKLWLSCFLTAKRDEGLGEDCKILFILDEVGNLGELKVLEGAIHDGAGYGIRVYMVLQALGQLEVNFPSPRCDAILAGCDLKIGMGLNDLKSARTFSEMIGKGTITIKSRTDGRNESSGHNSSSFGHNRGVSYSPQARDVVTPDELMCSDAAYAFVKGKRPILLSPVKYFEDREFAEYVPEPLRPTPSIYSWIIALAGSYFLLPVAWQLMPAFPRWDATPTTQRSRPSPVAAANDDVPIPSLVSDGPPRRPVEPPARPTPRYPSRATCPGCKSVFDIPEHYDGRKLRCLDCPTTFRVFPQQ